jgi:hypothetical protein
MENGSAVLVGTTVYTFYGTGSSSNNYMNKFNVETETVSS